MTDEERAAQEATEAKAAEDAAKAAEAAGKTGDEHAEPAAEEETEEQKATREKAEAEAREAEEKKKQEEKEHERNAFKHPKVKKEFQKLHTKLTELEKRAIQAETEARVRREVQEKAKTGAEPASATAEGLAEQFEKDHPEPKAEEFETVADHAKAVARWTVQQERYVDSKLAEAKESASRQEQTKAEKEKENQALQSRLDAMNTKGEEKYEDYAEVVPDVQYPIPVLIEISELDQEAGADIAYYLAHNPDEVDRLAKLAPRALSREMGRIETGLQSGKLQVKKTTSAPKPAATVQGNSRTQVDESKMSDQDWYNRKRQKKLSSA